MWVRLRNRILFVIVAVLIIIGSAVGAYYYTMTTPVPTSLISFEEAVEYALNLSTEGHFEWRPWNYSEYLFTGELQGEPAVTENGLLTGYLEWHASDGRLYQAEYPSDANMPPKPSILGEVERFVGGEDVEEYYVWRITLMDGGVVWVDAQNGDILQISSSRVPGVLNFGTALRIIDAPSKKVVEVAQGYKRLGNFEGEGYESTDGRVRGHLLWRVSNGTLYEVWLPFNSYPRKEIFYIEVPEDREEYNMWEITTEDKVYYIDARNGIIKLLLPYPTPTPAGRYLTYYPEHLTCGGNETKIFLLDASSTYGFYNESFSTLYSGDINKGDACVIVTLTIRNDYAEEKPSGYFISFTASLYNKEGKAVGWIMTPPPLLGSLFGGIAEFNLQSGEKETINIFLAYNKTIDLKDIDHYDLFVFNIQDAPTP